MAGKKFYNLYEVKITGFDEHTLLHGKIEMFGLIPWEIKRECIGWSKFYKKKPRGPGWIYLAFKDIDNSELIRIVGQDGIG